jgi:hypothetical protein
MSCPSVTNLTDSDLTQTYYHESGHTILPSVPYGTTDRTIHGLLHPSALSATIASFSKPAKSANNGNNAKGTPISVEDMISEYCFYHARYTYAIEKLVDSLRKESSPDALKTPPPRSAFYLKHAQHLHQQLMDFIQTVQGIRQALQDTSRPVDPAMTTFSKDLQTQQGKLEAQQKVIRSNQAPAALYKQMVRYSEEKTRRSDQLLHLYTFLNVVALGLLVYVYKAAE